MYINIIDCTLSVTGFTHDFYAFMYIVNHKTLTVKGLNPKIDN